MTSAGNYRGPVHVPSTEQFPPPLPPWSAGLPQHGPVSCAPQTLCAFSSSAEGQHRLGLLSLLPHSPHQLGPVLFGSGSGSPLLS